MIGSIVLVALMLVAGALFGRRALLLYRLIRLGQPVSRFDDLDRKSVV